VSQGVYIYASKVVMLFSQPGKGCHTFRRGNEEVRSGGVQIPESNVPVTGCENYSCHFWRRHEIFLCPQDIILP
jgi:hypothetical protein